MITGQISLKSRKVTLDDGLVLLMDEYLVSICEGTYSESALSEVKERVKELFKDKSSKKKDYSNWEMGAVAEFFIHLYLNIEKFKQECLFFNLEERSINKGFDGYYSDDENQWIMESKSGSISTKGMSHKSKLSEAVSDLEKKVSGKVKNNPWSNAYNHASHLDVSSASQIRTYIKNLSKDFTLKVPHSISEFNIIPCATIYYEGSSFLAAEEIEKTLASDMKKNGKQNAYNMRVSKECKCF